jgi:hypothetical protein
MDPCGRVMDLLRRFYRADCQFGTDPSNTRRIRWYRCAPGALYMGYPTRFGSEVWYGHEPYEGVGERPHRRSDWWNGVFPVVVPGTATPCGAKSVFQNGWPGPVPATLPRYSIGLAKCCGNFPQIGDQPWLKRPDDDVKQLPQDLGPEQRWNPAAGSSPRRGLEWLRRREDLATVALAVGVDEYHVSPAAWPSTSSSWIPRRSADAGHGDRRPADEVLAQTCPRSVYGMPVLTQVDEGQQRRVAAGDDVVAFTPRTFLSRPLRQHVDPEPPPKILLPSESQVMTFTTSYNPTYRNGGGNFQTGSNSLTFNFGFSTLAGSTLVAVATMTGATQTGVTAGWNLVDTIVLTSAPFGTVMYVYEFPNAPIQTTITVTSSAVCASSLSMREIQNAAPSSFDVASAAATGTSSSAASNTTPSTNAAPELAVAFIGTTGNDPVSSVSNGFAHLAGSGSTTTWASAADKVLSSFTTAQTTGTLSIPGTWGIIIRTYK